MYRGLHSFVKLFLNVMDIAYIRKITQKLWCVIKLLTKAYLSLSFKSDYVRVKEYLTRTILDLRSSCSLTKNTLLYRT